MNPARSKKSEISADSLMSRTSNGMKNQKGFTVVEGLLILVIVGLIGGVGWYVWDAKKESDKSLNQASSTDISGTTKTSETPTPDGYVKYENKELGISFIYLKEWGDVTKTEFDGQGNSDYFAFDKFDGLTVGGLRKDYTHPGRGGSLVDYGGFIEESNEFKFRSRADKSAQDVAEGYKLNTAKNCIVSTDVDFFEEAAYHAVCNLNNNETFGFNFAVYDISKIEPAEFLKVVNSVSIK